MYNTNTDGSKLLGKSITNITMSSDGLVSFDFMGGNTSVGISDACTQTTDGIREVYDLQGRRVTADSRASKNNTLLIVREKNGQVKKIFSR